MTRGVLYVALGADYLEEARQSASSLRAHMPEMPIALFTDQRVEENTIFQIVKPAFADRHPFRAKIRYISQSPFEETLYLDTDTYITGNCGELFDLLDRFDIACTADTLRLGRSLYGLPTSFPEMNTGVLLYRQSPQMEPFFKDWLRLFDDLILTASPPDQGDQPAFRLALYNSPLRYTALPNRYHCRYIDVGILTETALILHGRSVQQFYAAPRVARVINTSQRLRVYIAGQVYVYQRSHRWFAGSAAHFAGRFTHPRWKVNLLFLSYSMKKRGWRGTFRFLVERFRRL